uniref:DM10 domain-containing protein n=1 Tax=Hemiselmis andersenii TaxID=464988 RepID=A0A7S1H024_HEMAN
MVGGVITVFARQLVLEDCDAATRAFYEEEYGIIQGGGLDQKQGGRPQSAIVVPPHNGFGKEEDSRQNCISLHPKAPKVNVIRLLENKGKMLRFVGKLEHAVGFDVERVFTITYFLDTDEILIFEPAVKNSGRTGGKFMERCRVRKPQAPDYYTERDLFLGARIVIYARRFVLVDADEFTVKYMEEHSHEFPYSDMSAINRKFSRADASQAATLFRQRDSLGRGALPANAFKECVVRGGLGLNDQEAHTLARSLAQNGLVDYERLLASQAGGGEAPPPPPQGEVTFERSQEQLRAMLYKRGPGGVRGLARAMAHVSRGTGQIDRTDLDTVLGFCGVAMTPDAVNSLFARYDQGQGVVDASAMVQGLRVPLSRAQERAVLAVFETLEDPTFKTGAVEMHEVIKRYQPGRHPRVVSGDMSESEAMRELEDGLEGLEGTVMAKDLVGFYCDVVAGYKLTDDQLTEMLRAMWGISGRR